MNYRSDMPLTEFVDQEIAKKKNGRQKEYWFDCPKCEVGFKKEGSTGSKACPVCGYTRTVKRKD